MIDAHGAFGCVHTSIAYEEFTVSPAIQGHKRMTCSFVEFLPEIFSEMNWEIMSPIGSYLVFSWRFSLQDFNFSPIDGENVVLRPDEMYDFVKYFRFVSVMNICPK